MCQTMRPLIEYNQFVRPLSLASSALHFDSLFLTSPAKPSGFQIGRNQANTVPLQLSFEFLT